MQTGKSKITEFYPSLTPAHIDQVQNALCPTRLSLPKKVKSDIVHATADFLSLKKELSTNWEGSVLNSLDFHYSSEKLKIIEANTNASGYLLSNLILKEEKSILMYEKTLLKAFKHKFKDLNKIFIADENPESEKMYPEFLIYRDFFNRYGVNAKIIKTEELVQEDALNVYNRDTDFYLSKHPVLRKMWEESKIFLSASPLSYENIASKTYNPKEYELLNSEKYKNLKPFYLEVTPLKEYSKDHLWEKRKKLFFKPTSSFGSKGVYAGKSISRNKYDNLSGDYIAQELHPPGKISIDEKSWKYDIRAFFSHGGVERIVARVYQGQLTNFSNPGGGFALIDWID